MEVKKPNNKAEMISEAKPNSKALHELILYYLQERIDHNNIDIKYLIITNINEWFIFDEVWFEKYVFRNIKLKKDFENWKLSGLDTRSPTPL
jgi:adenine-specific DNA-methyltransferase